MKGKFFFAENKLPRKERKLERRIVKNKENFDLFTRKLKDTIDKKNF